MVHFFEPELREMRGGLRATKVLGKRDRRGLIDKGILRCVHVGSGRKIIISDTALRLLDESL